MTTTIRRATQADAALLADFAATTFAHTYGAYNDPANLAAHLAAKYSPEKQAAELADPSATYLLSEVEGALAAYAFLVADRTPPGIPLSESVELVRFYVAPQWQGRGIARPLMDACVEEAARRRAQALWLSVWQRNPRAIAFYRKCGFRAAGTTVFQLGSERQRDDVMVLRIAAVPTAR